MTKLFSMKSLAFAGAAAFALTLVAAPKADAADAVKLEEGKNVAVDYEKGTLVVTTGAVYQKDQIPSEDTCTSNANIDLVHIADGWGVYFGSGKNIKSYTMVADSNTATSKVTPAAITYDISNLLGKATKVGVSLKADGTDAAEISLTASPSKKASDIQDKLLAGESLDNMIYQYKIGNYGEWSGASSDSNVRNNLVKEVGRAKVLGTTLYVRVANINEKNVMTSPWSKEIKIKIKAKAKAPKVTIKTAKLKKAFEWKMGEKLEYRVLVDNKSTAWTKGSSSKVKWEDIIKNAVNQTVDSKDKDKDIGVVVTKLTDFDKLVDGDAIANDVTFQIRTAADTSKKKDASQITVVTLEQSKDSPTKDNIEIKLENGKKGKNVSAAAITSKAPTGYTAQYSLNNTAWKDLKSSATTIQGDSLTGGTIYLRLVGDGKDKKNSVLPSAVTKVVIPNNGTSDKITSENLVAKDGKWTKEEYSDYAAGTKKLAGGTETDEKLNN